MRVRRRRASRRGGKDAREEKTKEGATKKKSKRLFAGGWKTKSTSSTNKGRRGTEKEGKTQRVACNLVRVHLKSYYWKNVS